MKAEVERWLSACIVAGHDMPYGDNSHVSFEVEAPTLEALCRRWLAVEDAEIAEPAMQSGRLVSVIVRDGAHYKGQRLRLVPEAGQEVGK